MGYLIAQLIILAFKIANWVLIKTKLLVPASYIAIVLIFFESWYEQNTMLADGIAIALTACIIISWIFSIKKYLYWKKKDKEMDIAYARRIAKKMEFRNGQLVEAGQQGELSPLKDPVIRYSDGTTLTKW